MMMTERDALWAGRRARLDSATLGPAARLTGRVEQVADGIARVSGLPDARQHEHLRLPGGRSAFVLTLDEDSLAAVLLDDIASIEAGMAVETSGSLIEVPVGPALLGRVVDPLGRPLDGGSMPRATAFRAMEQAAPAIIERALVEHPLGTGILLVDALLAIGRGQRELIIGDRATGKTAVALDAIAQQRHSDVLCIYVAIGQRSAAVQRAIAAVHAHGDAQRCIFVVASGATAPGLQWLAPFAAFSMAEHFRDQGGHVLVVLDDLSKHAASHRELSLLTGEPPGREAYPGDIFHLHARLLERAGQLAAEHGGGSITALPIAETEAGNLAGFIPTNLISITDGQIVMDSQLFAANQRPAIHAGLSVSRVGGKAQLAAMHEASGRLRLDYAQFQELEAFTRFGGGAEARIRDQLVRGERIRILLRQNRFEGLSTLAQLALLRALAAGQFDTVALADVPALRARIAARMQRDGAALAAVLAQQGLLDAERLAALDALTRSAMTEAP
ncbi:MAG: F0F1 ATP synthase subunit alpha [Pseudomonadota bacterium]|nr:F0F1 ATP synthase subunit alpha [Pseudomonadota bacterium]